MGIARGLWTGAVAGAAGTTGLNAVTYLDMAGRGRGASSASEDTVGKLVDKTPLTVPGDDETRSHRLSALGSLNGTAVGVAVGAALGAARSAGWRPGVLSTGLVAAAAAMGITDGVMAVLEVTDPRTWGATDWASDVVPHLAYGFVTAATLIAAAEDPA